MNNRTIQKDREFILKISEEFFLQDYIVGKLNDFERFDIKGWEIWLQVEFYIFLKNHLDIKSVDREVRCSVDGRKKTKQKLAILDFMIHQKRKTSSIPLEIKQDISSTTCLRHMIKDIKKFGNIKYSGINTTRTLWCLGVHVGEVRGDIVEKSDYLVTTEPVLGTNFFYTLI
ncbi:hypothetical protein [Acinetobacter sp. ANC 3832]|uniref:hypothetical protein n=1 Tax=Acinetobacter sp. ANC 3832 TaxID=1977874 RepID=UPI000A32BB87|nr:hypothetical protein [Acinetobacter sp. ANC 3832]OTG94148.1 hypothetical protein B9T35_06985 [Acinetobacter sp. ANC 3832]